MSLTKLSLGGKKLNYSRPGRVLSVTSRLGTGKRPTLFYSVNHQYLLFVTLPLIRLTINLSFLSIVGLELGWLLSLQVLMHEKEWKQVGGQDSNREHILMALAHLDHILIRATHSPATTEAA
jgi:hypothetical protein